MSMPVWSPQQEVALKRAHAWFHGRRDKPYFQLAGWAGTGKTTLVEELIGGIEGIVYLAAYTGKAAHVLRRRSRFKDVSTIHKLIYKPKDKSQKHLQALLQEREKLKAQDPIPAVPLARIEAQIKIEQENVCRPMFALNDESPLTSGNVKLVVIDEYSMVDEDMGRDLLSFGVPILALGDPGQLPPVRGNPFFRDQPDVMLTEIHRQAADNPIIWMSREVREGRPLAPGKYGDSEIRRLGQIDREEIASWVLEADQLLVGRNATRQSSNHRARELLGRTSVLPQQGDKLVCLRNDHDVGLLNGQLWTARTDAMFDGEYAILDLVGEDDQKLECCAHVDYFHGNVPEPFTRKDAQEFDYGNALTVHKAQGSQYPNGVLFDEWYSQHRKEWLYTGITRMAEKIRILQM